MNIAFQLLTAFAIISTSYATIIQSIPVPLDPLYATPPSELPSQPQGLPFNMVFVAPGVPFAQQERERAQQLISAAILKATSCENNIASIENLRMVKRDAGDVSAINNAVTYLATVGVGSPPTNYTLVIDTGSSNTWVGARKSNPYIVTPTSSPTSNIVSVSYGSGFFAGEECTDQVSLSPNLIIQKQSIGVATEAIGFTGADGILGIGPSDLTLGTLTSDRCQMIPTVNNNLYGQGTIPTDCIGISYAPSINATTVTGTLSFGCTDTSGYVAPLSCNPITSTSPASNYWGIDMSAVSYGASGPNILSLAAGIVDTGTTLLLVATNVFNAYKELTGGTTDPNTGMLQVTDAQFQSLQSLFLRIGSETYELTPDAQLFPKSLNAQIGGMPDANYLVVGDLGSNSGNGLDFICGYAFLQRFYTVYDTTNQRICIATTSHTFDTSN